MKKKKIKYLRLYKKWAKAKRLPEDGLCSSIDDNEWLEYFRPTSKETEQLCIENKSYLYWASGLSSSSNNLTRWYGFTPLRQNIVLLMAALNNEL